MGYLPAAGARLVPAADSSLAAVVEPLRVVVVALPGCDRLVEIQTEGTLDATDVAWVGPPTRLLTLTRSATESVVRLVDLDGAHVVSEIHMEAGIHLHASDGNHAIALGDDRAAIIAVGETRVTPYRLPVRVAPTIAAAAAHSFILGMGGSIEEWDPINRVPRRRLRLPRTVPITALGGTARLIWLTTPNTPARIDVIPLINRGQPLLHELPEPIARVSGHPQCDLLTCVGASGRVFLIDLDGRAPNRVLEIDELGADDAIALCHGVRPAVLVARTGRPLVLEPLEPRTDDARPAPVAPVSSPIARPPVEEAPPADEPPRVEPAITNGAHVERGPLDRAILDAAIASLAPRATPERCSTSQYQGLLEHERRYAAAVAVAAIARDWDSGRLSFSAADRPPHEAEVLGIAGRRSGIATQRVAEAREALVEATDARAAARAALGSLATPFDELCAEHNISKLGEQVLLHVVAPALWGELARLYGVLNSDPARANCDEHLLWQLIGHTTARRDLARELDADAPLIRSGIVRPDGTRPRPFQALTADPVVVKLLSGASTDGELDPGVTSVAASVSLDELDVPRAILERALSELAATPGHARVVVRGRLGSGRRTLLAALAELAGRRLAVIDVEVLVRERQLPHLAARLQRAHLRGWLPCIVGIETLITDEGGARAAMRDILRDHRGPVAVRLPPQVQPILDPGYVLIDLPSSTIAERAAQWRAALDQVGLGVRNLDELAARFTIGPGTIRTVAAGVARAPVKDVGAAIDDAMRQHLETRLGAVATRVERLADWSQIVLPPEIEDAVVELIARVRHRRTVFDTWGFDRVMSTSRGMTALFQGGPGTGKTLVATAVANELKLDLYRVDLSRVMSKWIGETEQNLAKVFDAAEEGRAVILFDEADSLFGSRTAVRSSNDRYANLETNYLLQRLDSFEGIAILTTNLGTAIDNAFKRRLACFLTFPFPDDDARQKMWQVHLPEKLPRAGRLDLAGLARRYKMSGGYIRNACLRAAFLAAGEGTPLSQAHLERAIRAEFREGGKLAESGQLE